LRKALHGVQRAACDLEDSPPAKLDTQAARGGLRQKGFRPAKLVTQAANGPHERLVPALLSPHQTSAVAPSRIPGDPGIILAAI